jgi:hypothetical protein
LHVRVTFLNTSSVYHLTLKILCKQPE